MLLHTKHLEAKVCLIFSPSVVPAVSLWGLGLIRTCFFTHGRLAICEQGVWVVSSSLGKTEVN